jgi:RecJ-like exonuclease
MKNTISILLLAPMLALTACADKKAGDMQGTSSDTVQPAPTDGTAVADTVAPVTQEETEAPVIVTVQGKVTEIQQGKDGYTAQIKDDSGKVYFATISIPNLTDPKQYKAVKAGDVITVKGESWKMGEELHIKAEDLKVK